MRRQAQDLESAEQIQTDRGVFAGILTRVGIKKLEDLMRRISEKENKPIRKKDRLRKTHEKGFAFLGILVIARSRAAWLGFLTG